MSLIAIIGQLDLHPDDATAAGELMRVVTNESQQEQGCHHYTYSRDLSTAGRFQLSELWESEEALAAHASSSHVATYRAGIGKLRVLARRVQRFAVSDARDL